MAKKNYKKIVAPLAKIEKQLTDYAQEQTINASNLEDTKKTIEESIEEAKLERKRAEHTALKISGLLGFDDEFGEDRPEIEQPKEGDSEE